MISLIVVAILECLLTGYGFMTGFIGLFDTARDYTLQFTITHTHTHMHILVSKITSSLAASNGARSHFSGFPNYPRSQLSSSHSISSQLKRSGFLTNRHTQQPLHSTDRLTDSLTPVRERVERKIVEE
jgi:hypothetical protein